MYIDGCSLLWHFLFETLLNSWHCAMYIATYIGSSVATTPHPLTLCVLRGTHSTALFCGCFHGCTCVKQYRQACAFPLLTKVKHSYVHVHKAFLYIHTYISICMHIRTSVYVYAYPCPCVHQMLALKYHFKYICVSYIIYISRMASSIQFPFAQVHIIIVMMHGV